MQLQQLVERATKKYAHSIVVIEGSEHLVPFLGPLATRVVAPSDTNGPVLRLAAVGMSGVEDAVRSAAKGLGQHDLLVLAMRLTPDRLPVGALVDTLVACGLWVVEAAPAPARGVGCAFVVTRDDSAPWHSYLLGDTIPSTERSVLRLLAERAVEGLAVRAQAATLRTRDRERKRELDQLRLAMESREAELDQLRLAMESREAELDQLRLAMESREAELDRVTAQFRHSGEVQEAEFERVTEELRRAQRAEREAQQGGPMMRAVRLVRQDPVHGSARVLRSVLRRARDRGHAKGGTSEIDDSSV